MLKSKTDIIITSGAVSAGKFDYIPSVVKQFKTSHYFKSVMIRPGKPLLFAKINQKLYLVYLETLFLLQLVLGFSFILLLKIYLELLPEKPVKAVLKNSFNKVKNFTRFIKSKLTTSNNGKLEVELLKGQESFRINSFVKSNVWAMLPDGQSNFKKGQIIDCFLPNHSNKILD
jgi:molybdopterin molybdotransferase